MDPDNQNNYYLVFQLNGTLYAATIWILSQIWYNSVMIECTHFLVKSVMPIFV